MSLHVIRLVAENVLRLKSIDITPEGNTVIISGKNEAGKSSVLNVIWLAMKYSAASKDLPHPIRTGEDRGSCMLDLDEFIIKRWFTLNNDKEEVTTRLVVETKDGNVVKRPQELLDSFIGSLSFDPLEFIRMDGKKRRQLLADLIGLNLADFEAQKDKLSDERKGLKRQKAELQAIVTNIAPPTANEPTKEESALDLAAKLADVKISITQLFNLQNIVMTQTGEIASLENKLKILKHQRDQNQSAIDALKQLNLDSDAQILSSRMSSIEQHNARAREITKYYETINKIQTVDGNLNQIETKLTAIADSQEQALAQANLPISGLSIADDDVLFDDMPLTQLSTSQQIKISMALGMVANPKFRVIRIKDGSLLDKENLELINELAKVNDFQVWVECVDDSEKLGFYIENGEVKTANKCII